MGERPEGLTLDRIENDEGYYPDNCRWASILDQANNRRNNVKITYNGETKNISQWASQYLMKYGTLAGRLRMGWSIERALGIIKK